MTNVVADTDNKLPRESIATTKTTKNVQKKSREINTATVLHNTKHAFDNFYSEVSIFFDKEDKNGKTGDFDHDS